MATASWAPVRNSSRSSAEPTPARVAPGGGFRGCCRRLGHFDGTNGVLHGDFGFSLFSGQPVMDMIFPLREAWRAHERMEEGEHIGKIVLDVA